MIQIALALLATAQDPDRSTPDTALESFVEFWTSAGRQNDHWRKCFREAMAATDALRTEDLRKKWWKNMEESWKTQDEFAILPGKLNIKDRVAGDRECLFTCWRDMKIRSRNFTTGDVEEKDSQEPYSFTFERHGDVWLLKKMMVVCPICVGTGSCTRCGGTGLSKSGTCTACDGKKRCSRCGGKVMVVAGLNHRLFLNSFSWFVPEGEFSPSKDRSSPKAAAKAVMDSWIAREAATWKSTKAWMDENLPRFHKFLTPGNVAVAQEGLKIDLELGKRRYAGMKHEIKDVKEKDGRAFALTVATADGVAYEMGLRLAQSGDGWALEAELTMKCVGCAGQAKCFQCDGTGKCIVCKGTGTIDELDCIMCSKSGKCGGCSGSAGCKDCQGFGWVEKD